MAVGEVLRRLVGKALLATRPAKEQVASLRPHQVGTGVRCAAESVAIGTQTLVDNLGSTGRWVLLQVDVANAFNTIAREPILMKAQSR